ncbi:MAG: thioredoxin-disulfide reductase [Clostridiales bacterium]|nr:thioredoxin-disulfide reductase [Clostridiales bacterium]
MVYDLVIIGAGPSGLSAGIYAQRAMLKTVILEKESFYGGQVLSTYEVDNYPGFPLLGGFELADKFREHAESLGVDFISSEVEKIARDGDLLKIDLNDSQPLTTKAVIVATGSIRKKLGIKGEDEFLGKGVSYCATCDGAFFKEKIVTVVGGGDAALKDAIYLSRVCKQVYIANRSDSLKGAKRLQDVVDKTDNIHVLWETELESINGDSAVENIGIINKKSNEKSSIAVNGVFIAIGSNPMTKFLEGLVDMDGNGYVISDETGITNAKGIFVAGDIRVKNLRQIITAAADGANAVNSVERYLENF